MAENPSHSMAFSRQQWIFSISIAALVLAVAVLFFAVDLRFGFPHFDTYQYSASVGPQASGMRPKLLWVEGMPGFENGAELTFPGIYWLKLALFSLIPYSLGADQALSLVFLISSAVISGLLLQQAGWGRLAAFLFFGLVLTDPTFLVNAAGTRPEPLAVLLLLVGISIIRSRGSIGWAVVGGLALGLAGTVHVYAALLGPLIALSTWVSCRKNGEVLDWRRFAGIAAGLALGWFVLLAFWSFHPDAWHLFRTNLAVQRTFHHNPGRFMAYLASFRLASGWAIGLLLVVVPMIAWSRWFHSKRFLKNLEVPLLVTGGCVLIPAAYWVLKTDQYFYGVLIWPGLVAALQMSGREGIRLRPMVVMLMALGLAGGMARLVARARLGLELEASKSSVEQRLEWLRDRVRGAPRLYVFTREWDIAAKVGVSDVRFYTFPLPMTNTLVREFESRTFDATPAGAMLLFDRDYASSCPYANQGAFDPTGSPGWEMLETRIWNYDLSPSKPAARVWELWRRKEQS